MIRHLSWILVGLLSLTLCWAPLPFGSVTPWATAILQVASFLLLALALLRARSFGYFQPVWGPVAALAAIAVLGFLQAAPWPTGVVEAVSPALAEVYRQGSDLAVATGGESFAPRLTFAPGATRRTALTWVAWAALLAAAVVAGRHSAHRRVLGIALLTAAGFQILYGMERWLGAVSTIWDVAVPGASDRLRGTFVNPDHFAFFLEMALAVCFAWIWWAGRRLQRVPDLEARLLLIVPPILLWVTCFVGLAFSGSRAGLLAAVAGAAVQIVLAAAPRRRLGPLLWGGGLLLAGFVGVATLGARYGFGRLLETSAYELTWGSRLQAIRSSLGLWREHLFSGVGLGAFRDAFATVQPRDLQGSWSHAHSDWVELGVTTGILGVGIALAGTFLLLRRLAALLGNGLRSEDRAAALAALGALASAGMHEAVDFGLTMPANAFALLVICGAACGARLPTSSSLAERRRFHPAAREDG